MKNSYPDGAILLLEIDGQTHFLDEVSAWVPLTNPNGGYAQTARDLKEITRAIEQGYWKPHEIPLYIRPVLRNADNTRTVGDPVPFLVIPPAVPADPALTLTGSDLSL